MSFYSVNFDINLFNITLAKNLKTKIMNIKKLERLRELDTEEEKYILITFKNWYNREVKEVCIYKESYTVYAKNGFPVDAFKAGVVKSFINTNSNYHIY